MAVPIVFGTKTPFRNIERQFRQSHGEDKMIAEEQFFLKVWACMSEETDGSINTKTIEAVEVEILDTELNLNVTFLGQIQELLDSLTKLNASTGFLGNSAIVLNMGYL